MEAMVMKIKSVFRWLSLRVSPSWLAVLLVMLPAIFLLFVPPINGLADNGDYYIFLNTNNLYIQNPETYSYNDYFQNIYGIRQYFNETNTIFLSTSQLFITLAVWLNRLLFSSELFDLRFLAAVYLTALLPAIYLLTRGLTFGMSKKRSYLLAVIVAFIFGDGAYVIYFSSFYPEALEYIGLIYFAALLLYFFRVKSSAFGFFLTLVLTIFFLIGAQRLNFFLLLGVLVTAIGLLMYSLGRAVRLTLFASLIGLFGLFLTVYVLAPDITYDRDLYHSVNRGLLLEDSKPGDILSKEGINPQYGLLRGSSYYDEFTPIPLNGKEFKENLLDKTSHLRVALAYVLESDEFSSLLKIGVQDMYLIKPNELGNYLKKDSTQAAQKTNAFSLYTKIKAAVFPKNFGFFWLLFAVLMIVYGIGFYLGLRRQQYWLCFRFFIILGLFVNFFMTFVVAIISEGDADLTRHLFLSSVYLDLILLFFTADILGARLWSDERRFEE